VIRLSCSLAVVCGVSLRHVAVLFAALFLIPIPKSSIKRWMDAIGSNLPTPEEMLRQLLALAPATECHIDGSYPLGTDKCVMVVKDEHDRILMTHEAASENGDDARQFLQRCKALGLQVTAAFSDYSQSFTEAIKAVYPQARLQADHFHTVKNIWGISKHRCSPIAERSRRVGKPSSMRQAWLWRSSYGPCVGASSRSPAMYRWRKSRPLLHWKMKMKVLCTASAALAGSWCISSTMHTVKPKRSSDCNS